MPPNLVTFAARIKPVAGQNCVFYDEWDCGGNGVGKDEKELYVGKNGVADLGASELGSNPMLSWYCSNDDCDGVQKEGECHENVFGMPKAKVGRTGGA